jgi:hypothetical protein
LVAPGRVSAESTVKRKVKMKKTLTMAVATLIVGAVTASAAVIDVNTLVDTRDNYFATGEWHLPGGAVTWAAIPGSGHFWNVDVSGNVFSLGGGVNLYAVAVKGNHKVPSPGGPTASLAVGLVDYVGASGHATVTVPHPGGLISQDLWFLNAEINPAGKMNFKVTASHPIPEPGAFALIAGLGLVGFAAYRRTRA